MSILDMIRTAKAGNELAYWAHLRKIAFDSDDEPTEAEIQKAIKLAEKYGHLHQVEQHIAQLRSARSCFDNVQAIPGELEAAQKAKLDLPAAVATLKANRAERAKVDAQEAAAVQNLRYLAHGDRTEHHQWLRNEWDTARRMFPHVLSDVQ